MSSSEQHATQEPVTTSFEIVEPQPPTGFDFSQEFGMYLHLKPGERQGQIDFLDFNLALSKLALGDTRSADSHYSPGFIGRVCGSLFKLEGQTTAHALLLTSLPLEEERLHRVGSLVSASMRKSGQFDPTGDEPKLVYSKALSQAFTPRAAENQIESRFQNATSRRKLGE